MRRNFLKICQEEMPRLLGTSGAKRRPTQEKGAGERLADTSEDDGNVVVDGS
jgi:hypothetical protein